MRKFVLAVIVAGAVVMGAWHLLAQSPGAVAGPAYSQVVQPIFDRECVKCHGPKERKAKLDLSPGQSYKALVGVPSREVPGFSLVKAGNLEESYLWLKLDHRSSEGDGMPKGLFFSRKLKQADLEVIKAWIVSGSKP